VQQYYTLGDVVRILGLKPHVVTYAITSGHLPEPSVRVGNKRIFTTDDVERMALHFRVTPKLIPQDDAARGQGADVEVLKLKKPFTVESIDEARHEVRGGDGAVYCRTEERARALLIAGLLEAVQG
jgi:hypothetical protein